MSRYRGSYRGGWEERGRPRRGGGRGGGHRHYSNEYGYEYYSEYDHSKSKSNKKYENHSHQDRDDSKYDKKDKNRDKEDRDKPKNEGSKSKSYSRNRPKSNSEKLEQSGKHSENETKRLQELSKQEADEKLQEKIMLQKIEEERKAQEEAKKEELRIQEEERKRKAEEDRLKKIEEEKFLEQKKIEDEEKRKLQEEEEEKKLLIVFIEECKERLETKESYRKNNLELIVKRPDESFFSKLDSSLKKNTAFVKKLKNLTDGQRESLCKDVSTLNLSKYITECVSAIVEAKLKLSDVFCAVQVSSLIHQRYSEFSNLLLDLLQKNLPSKVDKITNHSKYRVDIRLLSDLISYGVFPLDKGLPILRNQLKILVEDCEQYINVVISFCRHCGEDYLGIVPRKFRILSEKHCLSVPEGNLLKNENRIEFQQILKNYYAVFAQAVIKDKESLLKLEKQAKRVLQTKGELSTERKDKLEAAQQSHTKMIGNLNLLSDLLEEDLPEIPEEEKNEMDITLDLIQGNKAGEYELENQNQLFEDEDERNFYEHLKDLKSTLPQILFKDCPNMENVETIDDQPATADEDLKVEDIEKELETVRDEDSEKKEDESEPNLPDDDDDDVDINGSMKLIFDNFVKNLPNCVNRDMIDRAAEDFCTNMNTKGYRKKLAKALFNVQRTRYDLLPFYSRFVATLHPCMPDVGEDLISYLKSDFRHHLRKKDQIHIESKLKTVRFIGELTKFKVFPKPDTLALLKSLLYDLKHHNIEMACAMLESCGRYLYRSPDSHYRTKVYLDVMLRKKAALALESRYNIIIENAYYYCNPPEGKKEERKERPPMHQYIRKLLYKDLTKLTIEKVLKQLRKLDWDNEEIKDYVIKCFSAIWNVRFNGIYCVANVLAGITTYHEDVGIAVVDSCIEQIRWGLELPRISIFKQRRLAVLKFIGELYNYKLIESALVFKVLFSLISFGVTFSDDDPYDPPLDPFRIRLVCTGLDVCGGYFDRGSSKRRLDWFLVYFQRYFFFKEKQFKEAEIEFPSEVYQQVDDLFSNLRPDMKRLKSYEEATVACEKLDKDFYEKLRKNIPELAEATTSDEGLNTIPEDEEDETDQPEEYPNNPQSEDEDEDTLEGSSTEGEGLDSHEDDIDDVKVHSKIDSEPTVEDTEFLSAFEKTMSESLQSRQTETVRYPQFDASVPINLKTQQRKAGAAVPGEVNDEKRTVNFILMTRRGNKQNFSALHVPLDAKLAEHSREREKAEREEQLRMKQMVLDIHERQENEDYRGVPYIDNMAPTPYKDKLMHSQNKGVPDADSIFGKVRKQ